MSTRFATHMRTTPDVDTSVAVPLDVRLMHMAASLCMSALRWRWWV